MAQLDSTIGPLLASATRGARLSERIRNQPHSSVLDEKMFSLLSQTLWIGSKFVADNEGVNSNRIMLALMQISLSKKLRYFNQKFNYDYSTFQSSRFPSSGQVVVHSRHIKVDSGSRKLQFDVLNVQHYEQEIKSAQ